MKKLLFISIIMLFCCFVCKAQRSVVREGNTFSVVYNQQQDTIKTVFTYKDNKGNIYPIWLNKTTGSVFIYRINQKTGHPYRQYMSGEIKENVLIYYNITIKKD